MKEHPAVFIRFFIKPFFLQKANSLDSPLFDTISSNQKFPIGSKVCITTPAHEGWALSTREKITFPERKRYSYVTGYEICHNEVVPILMKAKKDGTISKIRDYITLERVIVELA